MLLAKLCQWLDCYTFLQPLNTLSYILYLSCKLWDFNTNVQMQHFKLLPCSRWKQNSILLGYCAVCRCSSLRRYGTTCQSHLKGQDCSWIGCPATLVWNYTNKLHNNPEERGFHKCIAYFIHTYIHISFRRSIILSYWQSDMKLVRKNATHTHTHKTNKDNTMQYNTINEYQNYSLQNQHWA
jgi:hypothetical protein